jgi:ketosteroid isomerase-like protein
MPTTKDTLLSLKQKALDATQKSDADFYQDYLSPDAVAIVPLGIFDKAAIVQQMGSDDSTFRSSKIEDTRVIELTPDCGIVTYKAIFGSAEQEIPKPSEVYVTTVYARINGEWKGV